MKEVELSKGLSTVVDDEDFERINKFSWYAHSTGTENIFSARRTINDGGGKYKHEFMHNIILPPGKGMFVDHKDKNPLNNQKENLRICTKSQNGMNRNRPKNASGKYRGVSKKGGRSKQFRASIGVSGIRIYLGNFNSEIEAAIAYNEAAKMHHKEFANLNIIE